MKFRPIRCAGVLLMALLFAAPRMVCWAKSGGCAPSASRQAAVQKCPMGHCGKSQSAPSSPSTPHCPENLCNGNSPALLSAADALPFVRVEKSFRDVTIEHVVSLDPHSAEAYSPAPRVRDHPFSGFLPSSHNNDPPYASV